MEKKRHGASDTLPMPQAPPRVKGAVSLAIAKTPPNSPNAEQAVLAAILRREGQVDEAAGLAVDDFYTSAHRAIFQAMLELHHDGRAVDLVSIADALGRQGQLEDLGGRTWIAELAAGGSGNLGEAVRIVREHSARRQVIQAGLDLMEAGHNLALPLEGVSRFLPVLEGAARGQAEGKGEANPFQTPVDYMRPPDAMRWLIRGYLEAQSLAVIFGDSQTMKSFAAIDLALSVDTGTPWHGHATPNPGPAFIIAGEGGYGLPARIRAWCLAHGVDPLHGHGLALCRTPRDLPRFEPCDGHP